MDWWPLEDPADHELVCRRPWMRAELHRAEFWKRNKLEMIRLFQVVRRRAAVLELRLSYVGATTVAYFQLVLYLKNDRAAPTDRVTWSGDFGRLIAAVVASEAGEPVGRTKVVGRRFGNADIAVHQTLMQVLRPAPGYQLRLAADEVQAGRYVMYKIVDEWAVRARAVMSEAQRRERDLRAAAAEARRVGALATVGPPPGFIVPVHGPAVGIVGYVRGGADVATPESDEVPSDVSVHSDVSYRELT